MSFQVEHERHGGFFIEEEQHRLGSAVVLVAGAGGDGGLLAIELARMGVGSEGGQIRLADPEVFERENINRQACATSETVGMNKASVVASYISKINPNIGVRAFPEGVTRDNIDMLMDGVDLVIDETEFTLHGIGVALARAARARRVPNLHVLNVGFGAQVTSYDGKGTYTLENRLGLDPDAPLEEIEKREVGLGRWLAYIPKYVSLEAFKKVAKGEKPAPSVAPGVAIAAGLGATQATLHLLGRGNHRPAPVFGPRTLAVDAMTGRSRVVRFPRLGYMVSLFVVVFRDMLGMNPKTSY